jgi:hypothetical protein
VELECNSVELYLSACMVMLSIIIIHIIA